jgi:hypothetical protein
MTIGSLVTTNLGSIAINLGSIAINLGSIAINLCPIFKKADDGICLSIINYLYNSNN